MSLVGSPAVVVIVVVVYTLVTRDIISVNDIVQM